MQVVDIVLLALLLIALVTGIARGLVASLGAILGFAVGGAAAFWLVPIVNDFIPLPQWRAIAVFVTVVLLLSLGTALGSALGSALRRGVDETPAKGIDRLLGGVVGVVVAGLAVLVTGGTIAATGMPVVAAALGSSQVMRTLDVVTPPPVDEALARLRSIVTDDALPQLGELLGPGSTQIPDVALDDPTLAAAAASVARVSGVAYACGMSATGTGFVIADDRVVTNAHVVAGVENPVVELPGKPAVEGRIVYFDPIDDLAVIAVDDSGVTPLPLAPVQAVGDEGVVQGFPLGGPFTMGAAAIVSVGTAQVDDIYGETSNPREIYALAALVQPGNSGGPLLTMAGEVSGVIFARGVDVDDRGYAMTTTELLPVAALAPTLTAPVPTGACTT